MVLTGYWMQNQWRGPASDPLGATSQHHSINNTRKGWGVITQSPVSPDLYGHRLVATDTTANSAGTRTGKTRGDLAPRLHVAAVSKGACAHTHLDVAIVGPSVAVHALHRG